MTRGLIFILTLVCFLPMSWAQLQATPETLRTQIVHKIDRIFEEMPERGNELGPEIISLTHELHAQVKSYLDVTGTAYQSFQIEESDLSAFKIIPDSTGSWINKIAAEMAAQRVTYIISPADLLQRQMGHYRTEDFSVSMIAPPFTGQYSSVLSHELAHHVILSTAFEHGVPLFEMGWGAFTDGFIVGYPSFHFSEMTAIASSLLDFQRIPYSIELSELDNEKIRTFAKRLYQFTLIMSSYLSSYLNEDSGGAGLVTLNGRDYDSFGIQSKNGSQMVFDNFNLNDKTEALPLRLFRRFTPDAKRGSDGLHVLDLVKSKHKVRAFYSIIRNLENNLRPFTDMPANRVRVKAHLPWEHLQEANSQWLTVLGLPKDHAGHKFMNSQKEFILCGSGKDPVCQPIIGCEGLLE